MHTVAIFRDKIRPDTAPRGQNVDSPHQARRGFLATCQVSSAWLIFARFSRFYNYFGVYLLDVYGESIKKALKEEWVWVTENRIYPTPLGLKWNNRLGELFLL